MLAEKSDGLTGQCIRTLATIDHVNHTNSNFRPSSSYANLVSRMCRRSLEDTSRTSKLSLRGRIEDLRAAAQVVKGRKVASNVKRAMIVPGSSV